MNTVNNNYPAGSSGDNAVDNSDVVNRIATVEWTLITETLPEYGTRILLSLSDDTVIIGMLNAEYGCEPPYWSSDEWLESRGDFSQTLGIDYSYFGRIFRENQSDVPVEAWTHLPQAYRKARVP